MAKGVVDVLEVVHVNEHQRCAMGAACQRRQQLLHPVLQQASIGQTRQLVIKRQLVDGFFGLFALGDVGRNPAQRVDAAVGFAQRQLH